MSHKLPTINAEELLSCPMPPTRFIIDQLLPQGLHILAGATKIGKSWLALALCLCVVKGEALWSFAAQKCGVLYLCLEDSYQRIRCRLLDLTEDAPDTLYFSVMSAQLHNGLEQQIEQFLSEHPNTGLVVIDTLQRVRGSGDNGNPYANDYRDIGALKALADKHRIAILLIHHVRKLKSDDPMDMISGTNGISGATDTNFVLMKTSRSENTATLYCTGRDIVYRELRLEFDSETHLWNLLSDDSPHKSEMLELQASGTSTEQIIERLGNPKELARAYLGEAVAKNNGFNWRRLSAVIAFYSLAGIGGMFVLPITSICGIAFMVSGVLCPIAGIIKLVAHLMGYEITEIGISIGAFSANAIAFLPISILIGAVIFAIGWLLWKLTIVIIKSMSKGKKKLDQ